MCDFSVDENVKLPQPAEAAAPENAVPENVPAPAAVQAEADVQRNEVPVQEPAPVVEEAPAADTAVPEEAFAGEPAAEAQPAAAEASWSSEQPPAAAPHYTRTARAVRLRTRNRDQFWGVCIGVTLSLLCAGCIILLTFFAVSAGRGAQLPAGPSKPDGTVNEPVEPDKPDASLEVHETPRDEDGYTTQYIVEQTRDSVVGILTYDGTGIDASGGGTGIIMSEDAYIITNPHVVVDTIGLTVVMDDETRYSAKVVGYDEKTDLAVIKINASGLKPAEFGNSDTVAVGEKAIAIGNPGGLSGSVSQGVVSGLDREITITLSDNTVTTITAIQTDAAINPGNSGGPLLNAWGQVIGINSSKIVASGYEGIGFAIPVNDAKPIIDNLIQYGYVKDRAVLGITVIALDATNGPANGLPSQGLYIASIADYSDMNNHGIEAGDVIIKANGVELITTDDLTEELKKFRPGEIITMEIYNVYEERVVTVDILLLDSKAAEG